MLIHGVEVCSEDSSPSAVVDFVDRGLAFVLVTGHCAIKNEHLVSECDALTFVHVAGHCGIKNEYLVSECAFVHVAGHFGDFSVDQYLEP